MLSFFFQIAWKIQNLFLLLRLKKKKRTDATFRAEYIARRADTFGPGWIWKINRVSSKCSQACPVSFPEGHGLLYYICWYQVFQNLTRQVSDGAGLCPSLVPLTPTSSLWYEKDGNSFGTFKKISYFCHQKQWRSDSIKHITLTCRQL